MADTYYTNEMREFVHNLDNPTDFNIDVYLMEDDEGEYLSLVYILDDAVNHPEKSQVAVYMVALRNGLVDLGARVTFFPVNKGEQNA